MYVVCKRDQIPQITYGELMKEAFMVGPNCLHPLAPYCPGTVNVVIMIYLFGVMCIYLIFCATNLKQLIDVHTPVYTHFSRVAYMILAMFVIMPMIYIKNLHALAPFSIVGNGITVMGIGVICYYSAQGLGPFLDRNAIGTITEIPLFMGTSMLAVVSIGTLLSVEANMKTPQYWNGWFGVRNQAMFIVTIFNVVVGVLGYWKYGEEVQSSITLNIAIEDVLAQVVRLLFCAEVFVSYTLQTYFLRELLWEQYVCDNLGETKHPLLWDYILRTILVFSSFTLAVAIPRFGLFISLFGTFTPTLLGIVFPPLIDTCLRWPDNWGTSKIYMLRNIFLIIYGIFCWIIGVYTSVYKIYKSFD